MGKKLRSIGIQLVLFFVLAISIPTLLLALDVTRTTKNQQNKNTEISSQQTLTETEKGFKIYLKTLSQPVDLLTRKDEVKHLEDKGDLDTNIKAIQDSLIASVKVTDGSEKAYFTTKTVRAVCQCFLVFYPLFSSLICNIYTIFSISLKICLYQLFTDFIVILA